MATYRTLLFIPGIKERWFENIETLKADGIILDLEDSVPTQFKEEARDNVSKLISNCANKNMKIFVRINKNSNNFDINDLKAIVKNGLHGIVLPKIDDPKELLQLSQIVHELEVQQRMSPYTVVFIPILETAKSMLFAYEIASSERVIGIAGLSAKNGDVARALGYKWTIEGLETLYMRSKVVMAARAANVLPIGGLWQDVHNLDGLRKSAEFNRQLGFAGELILHPSNASIVNEVYSPSIEEISYYEGMVKAFNAAEQEGNAAIMYKGEHIDYAHVKTAKEVLSLINK